MPPTLEGEVPTTGLPGESLQFIFDSLFKKRGTNIFTLYGIKWMLFRDEEAFQYILLLICIKHIYKMYTYIMVYKN